MDLFPKLSRSQVNRYCLAALFIAPIVLGMCIFLRVCYIWKENPERYLDSPMSASLGLFISAVFILSSLLAIIIILATGGERKNGTQNIEATRCTGREEDKTTPAKKITG